MQTLVPSGANRHRDQDSGYHSYLQDQEYHNEPESVRPLSPCSQFFEWLPGAVPASLNGCGVSPDFMKIAYLQQGLEDEINGMLEEIPPSES